MPQLGRSQLFGRIEIKVFGEINQQAEIRGCLQYLIRLHLVGKALIVQLSLDSGFTTHEYLIAQMLLYQVMFHQGEERGAAGGNISEEWKP